MSAAGCGGGGTPVGVADLSSLTVDLSVKLDPLDLAQPLDLSSVDAGPCGKACAGLTPLCDPASRMCVACLVDADCPDQAVCALGQCRPGCAADHLACGDAGSCDVDMGACRGCRSDAECGNLTPVCDVAGGRCVTCTLADDQCPAGMYCVQGAGAFACVMGCKGDAECKFVMGAGGASAQCCNHACVDTSTSVGSCGACNAACNGACCAGKCTAVISDVNNCGMCRNVCPVNNNVAACMAGTCLSGMCNKGYADCNGIAADGCEADLGSDAMNCSACGKACAVPNAMAGCIVGVCLIASCNAGYLNCNGLQADGCEVHSDSDALNCGACGNRCANLPQATSTCTKSNCVVLACTQGFGNCNKVDKDGCESVLASDPLNCGACGAACPVPANTLGTCTNSVCGVGACVKNFGDCDGKMANGCEAALLTDVKNCGACNVACKNSEICLLGKCAAGDYGTGVDGAVVIAQNTTINSTHATAVGTLGTTTLTVSTTNGFAQGQALLLHQTQGTNSGQWEISGVLAVGNGSLTLDRPLVYTYKTSGGDHAQVLVMPQYSTLTVNGGVTLTAPAWDGSTGGILAFLAQTSASISGTVSMAGLGFVGPLKPGVHKQTGTQGEGSDGKGAASTAANNNGGGGGGRDECECCWGGSAGGGGHGTGGTDGQVAGMCEPQGVAGLQIGDAAMVAFHLGGAGGAGGADEDGEGGDGANGGGSIYFASPTITVTGTVTADGNKGGVPVNSSGCGSGGGGGGAGGAIFVKAAAGALGNSLVHATGGPGTADGGNCGLPGGAGAVGRIHFANGIAGTTNPAAQ